MIKIQEVWAYDERREGEIDLSKVSQIVSDARQSGLRVYFGVTMENAPSWLWKKYPDAAMVYNTGEPHYDPTPYVLPSDGKPGPCWHHPQAREAAIRFIEAVGKESGNTTTFSSGTFGRRSASVIRGRGRSASASAGILFRAFVNGYARGTRA